LVSLYLNIHHGHNA
jgi:phage-related protein